MFVRLLTTALSATVAHAHLAPWHKGMYGFNGVTGSINYNTDDVVHPLYQLTKDQWWFHHYNNVDQFPPAEGDFLELPAGGSFTVEIASNRGETSLSFNGKYATDWPDGQNYPEDYNVPTCITSPNMHTQNQTRAAGTAFAIAYTSDITKVTEDNLAVFTVRYHTPWKRITSYDVPADMPACPEGGCICAWGWVPNGCGQPNMYHLPYRCMVTGAKSTKVVGAAKAPVWCQNDPDACTKGPKQMIYWNQLDGNNIEVEGVDADNEFKSPAYNDKCGFPDGAQNDIFTGASSGSSSSSSSGSSSSSSGSSNSKSSTTSSSSSKADTGAAAVNKAKTPTSASSSAPSSTASAKATAGTTCSPRKVRRALAKRAAVHGGAVVHRRKAGHVF
ncbi:hypothetical protein C8F04DRAFT_1077845 [Mycena alexandri]|uniref:Uncharacterized protein n=1 Tax=Mycena alexandri TaxID=1745969 RepID=A0AAD6TCT1_9AGAR|nr:hypothetical protein C8F04DRAFT_1077845 [Mycena alexandri]